MHAQSRIARSALRSLAARTLGVAALGGAILTGACERPTAPTVLVYADRPIIPPVTSRGWVAVSAGAAHTCGVRLGGGLYCWGGNASGQLGVGTSRGLCTRRATPCEAGPRAVASTLRFATVSAGQRHTCAITVDRALYCWGENVQFQLGVEREVFVPRPSAVLPDARFLDVGAGVTHTCAVRTNGIVYCWGEGTLGALGRGDTASSVIPAPIATSQKFIRVRSGRLRSCAIAIDATLWCWGSEWESSSGGFDYFHTRSTPHRIDGIIDVTDVSVASSSICAVTRSGATHCWEANGFAQLGLESLEGTMTPTPVHSTQSFSAVTAGIIQTCGLAVTGAALCWGNNSFGQLGVPRPGEHCGPAALECSSRPIGVFGQLQFSAITTGPGNHTCGISTDTSILCWGLGSEGQLGDGFTRDRQSLPVPVLAPSS